MSSLFNLSCFRRGNAMLALDGLYVMLYTFLSGVFIETMVKRAGADMFMAKYKPDELDEAIQNRIRQVQGI